MTLYKNFSHIYVEDDAREYPDTQRILDRFSKAAVIPIRSYQEVFGRAQQRFEAQKQSLKLILAVKRDQLLYEGTEIAPRFDHEHFFYNAMSLNCIYSCEYCYLQGMYPSSNLVLFVNADDFFTAVREKLQTLKKLYLCISYDTDMLALEHLVPNSKRWVDFAAEEPGLTVELRTKSSNIGALSECTPLSRFILAWTLSPEEVARSYEAGTPGFSERLRAVKVAQDAGWPVRLCLDPLLWVEGWQDVYAEFIERLRRELDLSALHDISLGTLRINKSYLKRMRKQRPHSPLLHGKLTDTSVAVYYPEQRDALISHVREALLAELPEEKIVVT